MIPLLKKLLLNRLTLQPATWLYRTPGMRRRMLSYIYIGGRGIEIGALHNPMPVPAGAEVRYIDRLPEIDLQSEYRKLDEADLVSVQTVDDGHTLSTIDDLSQDFLIASHIIEHMENPLLALRNWLRVLRPGGILYLAIPNKERTFDRNRPVTDFDHLLRDLQLGPEGSRRQHYEEWMRLVGRKGDAEIEKRIGKLLERRPSIHFHVWDPQAFFDFLGLCRQKLQLPVAVLHFEVSGDEMLVIGKRTSPDPASPGR